MKHLLVIALFSLLASSCKTVAQSNSQQNKVGENNKKIGYWIEQDTIKVLVATTVSVGHDSIGNVTYANPQQHEKYETVFYRNEGQYNNSGLRAGLWKYFQNGTLVKEITYSHGKISAAKMYDLHGNIKTTVEVDSLLDMTTIKEFNTNGKVEKTYTLPTYLLHIEHNY